MQKCCIWILGVYHTRRDDDVGDVGVIAFIFIFFVNNCLLNFLLGTVV